MTPSPQPYPGYKHSGIPWLGDLPEHWEVRRGGWLFRKMDRPVRDVDEVITCFRDGTVTLRKNRRTEGFTESLQEIGYQGVRKGDLVIHQMDAFAGAIGVSDSDGKGTPVYSLCYPTKHANPFYYALIVREMARSQWILALAKGIRERSTDFRYSEFSDQTLPLPTLSEQAAIVRYLDYVDRRIRRYVSAKRKLIALLEEEKQAVISQAVTRGLDPSVRLKLSGVEWLGDVPEHWEVRRAKFFYREADERSTTGTEELMSVSHKTGVTPRKKTVTMFLAESNMGYKLCRPGDIVINTMWAFMAALGVARQNGLVSPSYGVYRPLNIERLSHDYIDSLLRTEAYRTNYLIRSTGITSSRLRLYPESFLDIPVLCPPSTEQDDIVEYLERATAATNGGIERAHRRIELLQEYRTKLIADVVTGKLDVREAAAHLPDEADDQDPIEESDPLADGMGEDPYDADNFREELAMESEVTA